MIAGPPFRDVPVTAGLPGDSAVGERWKTHPATAVAAIGRGLRVTHDTLPVADCPFSWSADDRVDGARRRRPVG